MTDRELLELAAKAAGLELNGTYNFKGVGLRHGAPLSYWNPLAHNDEAFWLAVTCGITFRRIGNHAVAVRLNQCDEYTDGDPCAAARRAIVRAAAVVGQAQ